MMSCRALRPRHSEFGGQRARGGGVVELGLAGEQLEAGEVEVELGAGQRIARVDELDLADRALVALAAGDAIAAVTRRVGAFPPDGSALQRAQRPSRHHALPSAIRNASATRMPGSSGV